MQQADYLSEEERLEIKLTAAMMSTNLHHQRKRSVRQKDIRLAPVNCVPKSHPVFISQNSPPTRRNDLPQASLLGHSLQLTIWNQSKRNFGNLRTASITP